MFPAARSTHVLCGQAGAPLLDPFPSAAGTVGQAQF